MRTSPKPDTHFGLGLPMTLGSVSSVSAQPELWPNSRAPGEDSQAAWEGWGGVHGQNRVLQEGAAGVGNPMRLPPTVVLLTGGRGEGG